MRRVCLHEALQRMLLLACMCVRVFGVHTAPGCASQVPQR
jgi:hypothetical protein